MAGPPLAAFLAFPVTRQVAVVAAQIAGLAMAKGVSLDGPKVQMAVSGRSRRTLTFVALEY